MIGIIGKKVGMTQIFNEQGQQIPCTVVEAPPNPVVQVLAPETNGVASVQLGSDLPTKATAKLKDGTQVSTMIPMGANENAIDLFNKNLR